MKVLLSRNNKFVISGPDVVDSWNTAMNRFPEVQIQAVGVLRPNYVDFVKTLAEEVFENSEVDGGLQLQTDKAKVYLSNVNGKFEAFEIQKRDSINEYCMDILEQLKV